jgi:hypothetical protein
VWLLVAAAQAPDAGPNGVSPQADTAVRETRLGPRIVFENLTNDFGRVAAGKVVQCDFKFSNPGDETLRIQQVVSACGCTSMEEWPRTLKPGEKAILPLRFQTANFDGQVYKRVSVLSNAKNQTNVHLTISGTVWQPVEVIPTVAVFGLLSSRNLQTNRTLRIVNNLPQAITIEPPDSSSDRFRAQLRTLSPGKEFALEISTVPPLSNGNNYGIISMRTSAAEKPVINLPTYATVQPIIVIPQQVVFSRNTLIGPSKLAVLIINNQERKLSITNPRINISGVEITLREPAKNSRFVIDLTFPENVQFPKERTAALCCDTDNPEVPTLTIPIVPAPVTDAAR